MKTDLVDGRECVRADCGHGGECVRADCEPGGECMRADCEPGETGGSSGLCRGSGKVRAAALLDHRNRLPSILQARK